MEKMEFDGLNCSTAGVGCKLRRVSDSAKNKTQREFQASLCLAVGLARAHDARHARKASKQKKTGEISISPIPPARNHVFTYHAFTFSHFAP